MVWLAVALMAYPILELSRLIFIYFTVYDPGNLKYLAEFSAMWICEFTGIYILLRRAK